MVLSSKTMCQIFKAIVWLLQHKIHLNSIKNFVLFTEGHNCEKHQRYQYNVFKLVITCQMTTPLYADAPHLKQWQIQKEFVLMSAQNLTDINTAHEFTERREFLFGMTVAQKVDRLL